WLARGFMAGSGVSLPSLSITTPTGWLPPGMGSCSTAAPVPDTEAWTGEHTPSPPPTFWPPLTVSPPLTRGEQGAPMCWDMGMITLEGAGIGTGAPPRDSALPSLGWIPPLKSCFILSPLYSYFTFSIFYIVGKARAVQQLPVGRD